MVMGVEVMRQMKKIINKIERFIKEDYIKSEWFFFYQNQTVKLKKNDRVSELGNYVHTYRTSEILNLNRILYFDNQ